MSQECRSDVWAITTRGSQSGRENQKVKVKNNRSYLLLSHRRIMSESRTPEPKATPTMALPSRSGILRFSPEELRVLAGELAPLLWETSASPLTTTAVVTETSRSDPLSSTHSGGYVWLLFFILSMAHACLRLYLLGMTRRKLINYSVINWPYLLIRRKAIKRYATQHVHAFRLCMSGGPVCAPAGEKRFRERVVV